MKIIYALLGSWIAFAPSASAAPGAPLDAKGLLQQVEKNVTSKDEVGTLKMTIVEADGSSKERTLEIRRLGEDGQQRVLVRLQAPQDLKGTALLSKTKGKTSEQWLYLPSQKEPRRIQSGKRSGTFLDSELSYEDLGSASDTQVESKVLRQEKIGDKEHAVIESTLKGESSYGKVLVWVDLDTKLVTKTEIFDKALKPLKETSLSGYQKFQGVWRAQRMEVKNLQNKRGTILELSNLKVNQGLDTKEFSESALVEGD